MIFLLSVRWLPPVALFPTWYVRAHKANINFTNATIQGGWSKLLPCLFFQHGSTRSTTQRKRGSIPRYDQKKETIPFFYPLWLDFVRNCLSMIRSKSVDQMMEHVMERHYHFDLTYITERIISVFFLPDLEEQQYCRNLQEVASMLKSKHQDKFLVSGDAEETDVFPNWSMNLAQCVNLSISVHII